MSESLFNKVTGLYPTTSLNRRTPTHVFSDEFCKIFKTPFYRTPPGDCFCSTEKYFISKMIKNPLTKKKRKWKQLVRKTTTHAKQKLNHYLHQFFISFYHSKISLFLFSLLSLIDWKQEFLETMQSHWGCIYYRKLFLTFGLKRVVFICYKLRDK